MVPAAIVVATAIVLPVFLTGALSVEIGTALHLGEARLGLAVAAFFLAAAVTSAAFGHLVQRIGAIAQMRIALLMASVCCAAISLLARVWWELPAILVVGGLANAAGQPAANLLLATEVPVKRQGLAFGAKQAAIPLSTLLAGLAVPLVALTVGWRFAFAGAAVIALAAIAVLPVSRREHAGPPAGGPSHRSGSLLFRRRSHLVAGPRPGGSAGSVASPGGKPDLSRASVRASVRRGSADADATSAAPRTHSGGRKSKELGTLVVLACAMALGSSAATSLGAFVVPACVAAGFRPGTAGLLAALGSVVGLGARLVAGVRADRRGGRHLRAVALMLASGSIGYLGLALGSRAVDVVAVAVAFGAAWGWPGLFNLAIVRTHDHAPGWATGVTQTGAYAGGALGPFVFGTIVGHLSYGPAWLVDAGLALAAVGGMLIGRRMLRSSRDRREDAPITATCSENNEAGQ